MSNGIKEGRGRFATRFGFVMAAAGSAVGLGNIWKFPYITGEYGGGAFVIVYLLCILLVGLPLMYAELIIGRRGGSDVLGALRKLTADKGSVAEDLSTVTGMMAVASGFLILSFYSVVAGWAIHFFWISLDLLPSGETGKATFDAMFVNDWVEFAWHCCFMILTVSVVARGVQAGIERTVSRLMPALMGILLLLLLYVLFTGGVVKSLSFLFSPDFSKLTPDAYMEALGHSFFTLSLGMGAMVTYGSYLKSDSGVFRDGVTVAVLDTVVALLAGVVIFAVVFDGNQEAGETVGLVFMTLPDLFTTMPGGQFVSAAFFLLLIFAAWSSAISLLEVVVAWLVDQHGIKRTWAAWGVGFLIWGLGNVCLHHSAAFDFLDNLTTKFMLPLGGLLIAIAAGWFVSKKDREAGFEHLASGAAIAGVWTVLIRFVTPVLVLGVILYGMGIRPWADDEEAEVEAPAEEATEDPAAASPETGAEAPAEAPAAEAPAEPSSVEEPSAEPPPAEAPSVESPAVAPPEAPAEEAPTVEPAEESPAEEVPPDEASAPE